MSQKNEQSFSKTQALVHIEYALKALNALGAPVTLKVCFSFLSVDEMMTKGIEKLKKVSSTDAQAVVIHFKNTFLNQLPKQLAAVKSTIFNYLKFFNNPDIENVFFLAKGTVTIEDIDTGKVFCLSIPQKYNEEHKYFKALLKFLFYMHALRRFDLTAQERQ